MLQCFNRFAELNVTNDRNIFKWMSDRRVLPHSLGQAWIVRGSVSNRFKDLSEFYDNYIAITQFVWPEQWCDNVVRTFTMEIQ